MTHAGPPVLSEVGRQLLDEAARTAAEERDAQVLQWVQTGGLEGNPGITDDQAAEMAARAHANLVAAEVRTLRVRDEARRTLAAEQAGPVPPFDLGTLREVLARPDAPPPRADGLIPADAGTLVVAQRKAGKSTLLLNLARALLEGGTFLGRFPVEPVTGTVALLNFEVGAAQLARWAHEVGVPDDRLLLVNLRGRRNPLGYIDDRARLAALLAAQDVESLLVDPFGRAYTGTSQNDSGEVGAFLGELDRFARSEVGARDVVLAAHAGWNGERTRGASALEDWADSIVTLTRGSDDGDEASRYLRAEGRDVQLDEDRLDYDPDTRALRLAGAGSRKVAAKARAVEDLVPTVVQLVHREAATTGAGCSGYRLDQLLRDSGTPRQKGAAARAAQVGVDRGLLRVTTGARGASLFHLPDLPATSPRDVPPPPPPPIRGEVGGGAGQTTTPAGEVAPLFGTWRVSGETIR